MRGRTNWRLFSYALVPSLAAGTALFIAVSQGVLAASFLISNQQFKETAERVVANGVIQYGAFDRRYDGKIVPVLVTGTKESKSEGLCQSVVAHLPVIGTITVRVTAKQATARDTYSDAIKASNGTATLVNSNNGIAAGASRKGPGINEGDNTDPGSAALEADSVVLTDSKQIVVATSARISRTIGYNMRFVRGIHECF